MHTKVGITNRPPRPAMRGAAKAAAGSNPAAGNPSQATRHAPRPTDDNHSNPPHMRPHTAGKAGTRAREALRHDEVLFNKPVLRNVHQP